MPSGSIDLRELVARLASRGSPRAEATVQSDVRLLLLAAPLNLAENQVEVVLEAQAGGGRRIDVEAGFTVFEVKRDLRVGNVRGEAVDQLAGYVAHRAQMLGQRYVGVLTDGAEWHLYHETPAGELREVALPFVVDPIAPDVDALVVWLESVLATGQQIAPTPDEIEQRLGADSPSHRLDYADLEALFEAHMELPTVRLKRELWARLLTTAFGTGFRDESSLFVEHTLLVMTAEIIAHAVVGFDPNAPGIAPATLLGGGLFERAQIGGVVEEDFFDWVLEVPGGESVVRALARRLSRFAWSKVEHDVMKVLYESVISAKERHRLGEYYTPDWLAERMVAEVSDDPLETRILDPACGSGTFLFHAVRQYLATADGAGMTPAEAIAGVTEHVVGVDVHPVAVTFARVTYLLAIGMERLRSPDRGAFGVPVYLGDSLQWGQEKTLLTSGALTVTTEDGAQLFGSELRFPDRLVADAGNFDRLVAELADRAAQSPVGSSPPSLAATFRKFAVHDEDQPMVSQTFKTMCDLHGQGRDHIWGYYVRNLARPTWLAHRRVDALIGNPPWLAYRFMTPEMQTAFRAMSEDRGLWAGQRVAPQQDLSGLFVVRAVELYLRSGGQFGFVMPYAALSRQQFKGFRTGHYATSAEVVRVQLRQAWDLERVRPHPFPVPSSVVFGRRAEPSAPLPPDAVAFAGKLPAAPNLSWKAASEHLVESQRGVAVAESTHTSPYRARFTNGATLYPRVLLFVEDAPEGPLGVGLGRREVRSARSNLEKPPWKTLPSLTGVIEQQFVRPVHLGATLAPYRLLPPGEAVIPWDGARLLSGDDERLDLYPGLSDWWRRAEALWVAHRPSDRVTLEGQIDYMRKLSQQFPLAAERVVYTKAGNRLAAARLSDPTAAVDHTLYWAAAASVAESRYLTTIFNSATLTNRVAPLQARGAFGARHFDMYVFQVAIPLYDPTDDAHTALADLGAQAEDVASKVALDPTFGFKKARRLVRDALTADGVAARIEQAVDGLIPLAPT